MLLGTMTAAIFANSVAVEEEAAGRTAKTVTAYGDAQVDTAQYEFGGASALFDGTGDYLYAADPDGDFLFGTSSDFTIEFWYKKPDTGVTHRLSSNRGGYNTGNWYIQFDHTTDKIQWGVNGASAQRSTNTFDDTNWHHLALVRSGSDFELFIDGASENTLNGSYQFGRSGDDYIKFGAISTLYGNVHIDEMRVSNVARYTSAFTAPTSRFGNDSNTLLLIHADGTDGSTTFTDDAGARNTIPTRAYNDAQVDTAQYKIGSASALFDGTDYIELSNTANELTYGERDFTIEFWLRASAIPGSSDYDFVYDARSSGTGTQISLCINDSKMKLYTAGAFRISSSSTISSNTWYHFALTRTGGTTTLWQDGSSVGTYSDTNDYTSRDNVKLGLNFNNVNGFVGHLDEVRISNTARYTSSFTPSTTAFTNDDNTIYLLHAEGSDASTSFTDDAGLSITYRSDSYASSVKLAVPFDLIHEFDDVSHLITNSTSSEASKTTGPASSISEIGYFADYEKSLENASGLGAAMTYTPSTSIPSAASGTYVVECWVKASSSTTNANWCLSSGDSGGRWLFAFNTGTSNQFAAENWLGLGDTNWHHVAIVCDGGTKRAYLDGKYEGAWSSSNTGFSTLHVGQFSAGDSNDFNGRLQDLRVTIGSNRGYTGTNTSTANFTLPSSIVESYS